MTRKGVLSVASFVALVVGIEAQQYAAPKQQPFFPRLPQQPQHQQQQQQQQRAYRPQSDKVVRKRPVVDAACCLKDFPADHYGKPKPLLDQMYFDECPSLVDSEAICSAATDNLVYAPSKLVVDKMVHEGSAKFQYDKWKSSSKADLAVVATGCCLNVYASVKPGDELNGSCRNPLIGSADELAHSVFRTSVMAAGDANIRGVFSNSVIVGGDYLSAAPSKIAVASTGGPYEDAGFVLGGLVSHGIGNIVVEKGLALVSNPAGLMNRVVASSIEILRDPELAVKKISAQICAVSKAIAQLKTNSQVLYFKGVVSDSGDGEQEDDPIEEEENTRVPPTDIATLAPGGSVEEGRGRRRLVALNQEPRTLLFSCTGQYNPCVFELSADELALAVSLRFNARPSRTIKINVYGSYITTPGLSQANSFIENPPNQIVWNFPEAYGVFLQFNDPDPMVRGPRWPGSIVCPKCDILSVCGAGVDGTVANGYEEGTTVVKSNSEKYPAAHVSSGPGVPHCPLPQPKVHFCKCLCPEKKVLSSYPHTVKNNPGSLQHPHAPHRQSQPPISPPVQYAPTFTPVSGSPVFPGVRRSPAPSVVGRNYGGL